MSTFNVLTDMVKNHLQSRLDMIQQLQIEDLMLSNENMVAFLHRSSTGPSDTAACKTEAEIINGDLEYLVGWSRKGFASMAKRLYEHLKTAYLDNTDFGYVNRAWLSKASWVMVRIQPVLERSDLHAVRWYFPDVDAVAADEGLEFWGSMAARRLCQRGKMQIRSATRRS